MLSNAAGSTSSPVASLAMISSLGQFAPFQLTRSASPPPGAPNLLPTREAPGQSSPDSPLEQAGFDSRSHRPFSLLATQAERRSQSARRENPSLLERGPGVRIRLAPAASPFLQWTMGLRAKSPALSRRPIHGWRRETEWAERKPALP